MQWKDEYLRRAREIIGDRTPAEKEYDDEVLRGLRRGESILQAIARANEKYPPEALAVDASNEADMAARYDYMKEHEKIVAMMAARGHGNATTGSPGKKLVPVNDTHLAILSRIEGGSVDKAALVSACEKLDGVGRDKVAPIIKQLKKDGLVFGEVRDGKVFYSLTVQGKARLHDGASDPGAIGPGVDRA